MMENNEEIDKLEIDRTFVFCTSCDFGHRELENKRNCNCIKIPTMLMCLQPVLNAGLD